MRIQRITNDGSVIETIAENNGGAPLSSPASMAFSRNHNSIYVANLNESGGLVQGHPDNPLLVQVTFPVPVQAWDSDCGYSQQPGLSEAHREDVRSRQTLWRTSSPLAQRWRAGIIAAHIRQYERLNGSACVPICV